MSWILLAIAAWLTLGALAVITSIGKPRKQMTPGAAAIVVLIDAAIIVALVLAARELA